MTFEPLIKLGCQQLDFSSKNRVRFTNIVAIITFFISATYTINYLFILQNYTVAFINTIFTFSYAITLLLNYFLLRRAAKVWFFFILIVHIFICTNLYVTNASGFHLYFFLVPTGAYLLFDLDQNKEKLLLSLAAVIGFFYCENTLNTAPLIELSAQANQMMYQSVIFFNMIEVIVVMSLFTNQIAINEAQLTQQATTDALTGVANRHYFFTHGHNMLFDAQQLKRPFTIVLVDIDHFKNINDTFGHFDGDICLKEISQLIKNRCRSADLFARIGGEEFVLALTDTTKQEALILAEQIRTTLEQHVINLSQRQTISCTASFGISSLSEENEPLKALLVNADKALYEAKTRGRNRSVAFSY
ncbi:GGDEF domain-containing protein [Thalassotalea sp. PLHSN55]|uniref:GGDEF domain-containing protein n=1 Tax=Thalassotalea sp. PLHSN55 TaxID=3435888 RepID=UPI003F87AC7D